MSETTNFRDLLKNNKPLKIVGAINAYSAILAKSVQAISAYIFQGAVLQLHLMEFLIWA